MTKLIFQIIIFSLFINANVAAQEKTQHVVLMNGEQLEYETIKVNTAVDKLKASNGKTIISYNAKDLRSFVFRTPYIPKWDTIAWKQYLVFSQPRNTFKRFLDESDREYFQVEHHVGGVANEVFFAKGNAFLVRNEYQDENRGLTSDIVFILDDRLYSLKSSKEEQTKSVHNLMFETFQDEDLKEITDKFIELGLFEVKKTLNLYSELRTYYMMNHFMEIE